jgi:cytoskeletal protein CcmA (bactofilin family)
MSFFGGREARAPQHDPLENVVGPTASFTGTLRSDGGVRVEGAFEGVIESAGNVVIGEGARVKAEITARNVTVGGHVEGNIDATGRLEILATGQVMGDIAVASVMIDDGGVFQGTSRMRGLEQPALSPPADDESGETPEGEDLAGEDDVPEVHIEEPDEGAEDGSGGSTAEDEVGSGDGTGGEEEAVDVEPRAVEGDVDFDNIEPVIPDVVIEDVIDEEPPKAKPKPRTKARPRRRGSGRGR